MRMNIYNLKRGIDTPKISLVKEKSINYPSIKKLNNPNSITEFFYNSFINVGELAEEYVWVLATDTKNNFNSLFEISHGGQDYSSLPVREICTKCLLVGAVNVIIIHNHPTGEVIPSSTDIQSTERVKEAFKIVGLNLNDHIIIGGGRNHTYYSFYEESML